MFIFFSFMIIISSQSPIVPGQSNTSRSTSHFQSPRELWIKSWTRPTYSSSPNRIPTPRKNLLSFDLLCSQANSQPIIPSTTIHPTNRRDRMLALRNALFPSVLHAQEWFSWLFRAVGTRCSRTTHGKGGKCENTQQRNARCSHACTDRQYIVAKGLFFARPNCLGNIIVLIIIGLGDWETTTEEFQRGSERGHTTRFRENRDEFVVLLIAKTKPWIQWNDTLTWKYLPNSRSVL